MQRPEKRNGSPEVADNPTPARIFYSMTNIVEATRKVQRNGQVLTQRRRVSEAYVVVQAGVRTPQSHVRFNKMKYFITDNLLAIQIVSIAYRFHETFWMNPLSVYQHMSPLVDSKSLINPD